MFGISWRVVKVQLSAINTLELIVLHLEMSCFSKAGDEVSRIFEISVQPLEHNIAWNQKYAIL
jgi:hypothetical protein